MVSAWLRDKLRGLLSSSSSAPHWFGGSSKESLVYDPSPPSGESLVQGEILAGVVEHRATYPPIPLAQGEPIEFDSERHPQTVVLNPYCDLFWDHGLRRETNGNVPAHKLVPSVFLCDAYKESEIKSRGGLGSFTMAAKHQEPRYHLLPAAEVVDKDGLVLGTVPALYLDFKKCFAVPTSLLYEALGESIRRIAVVPRPHREHMMVRYGYYVSRVSLPDERRPA